MLVIISQTATRETGSRPVVGSSRKKILGRCTRPRAISSRRHKPTERCRSGAVPQAAGDLQPPAHASGEIARRGFAPLIEIDQIKQLVNGLLTVGRWDSVQLGVDAQVFPDGKITIAGHGLGNNADGAAGTVG